MIRPITQNEFSKLSKRLKILILIYEYQIKNKNGIGFNHLVKISGEKRETVSKCQDSLMDMGLITDEMFLNKQEETWSKIIYITEHDISFVEKMILNIIELSETKSL